MPARELCRTCGYPKLLELTCVSCHRARFECGIHPDRDLGPGFEGQRSCPYCGSASYSSRIVPVPDDDPVGQPEPQPDSPSSEAAGPPSNLRPYRPRGGGVDTFDPSDCPPEYRFHAFIQRYDEFLWRLPRPGGKAAWIWWRELSPGCPRPLIGDSLPYSEFSLGRAAQWFSDNDQAIPPILADDIARERQAPPAGPAEPRDDALEPVTRAAINRLRAEHARDVLEYRPARPPVILPRPESITLGALGWLIELTKGSMPTDPDAAYEYNRVEALILDVPGMGEMKRRLNCELGFYLTGPALDEVRRRLARRIGRSFDEVDRMPISEIAALPWDDPASPPVRPSPPAGSDGRTEAAFEQPGRQPDAADAPGNNPAGPAELADEIRRRWPRRKLQAVLVEQMGQRSQATYFDVASDVYGDTSTDGGAIEQLVIRTNESLVELGASFYFRYGGERIFREPIEP